MATYYNFKYKGMRQELRWELNKVLNHILGYVKLGNKPEDYEIIKVEETSLGSPALFITIKEIV